jgi:hypothetical protein
MEIWKYIVWGVHLVLAVWALTDLFRNPRFDGAIRWLAAFAIVIFPLFGPAIYYTIRSAEPKSPGLR